VRRILPVLAAAGLLAALTNPARGGVILNTLQGYDDGHEGWSGGLDGLYSGAGGNTERILFTAGGRVQWQKEINRWRLQVSGGYEESGQKVTARHGVVHLRQNHDFNKTWTSIVFVQVQSNRFQRLESRWLAGVGARWNMIEDEKGRVGLGMTPMLEVERIVGWDGHQTYGRMSVFVHAARDLTETTRLDLVGFWQPRFDDPSDVRTVGNITLAVKVNGHMDLKVGAALEYNSRPAPGVKDTDWSTFVGLGWDF